MPRGHGLDPRLGHASWAWVALILLCSSFVSCSLGVGIAVVEAKVRTTPRLAHSFSLELSLIIYFYDKRCFLLTRQCALGVVDHAKETHCVPRAENMF